MEHERQLHDASCFLTLTYDPEHLPPHGQLMKSDLQKFFKRLRHHAVFRYVACGEYGESGRRPHFHVALFGLDFLHDRVFYKSTPYGPLFESPTLAKFWTAGSHKIGALTFESSAYIARYITGKIKGPGASPLPLAVSEDGEVIFPNPEFLLASRNPAIGVAWMNKHFGTDVFPHGRVITPSGVPAPVPRIYKEKLTKQDRMQLEWITRQNQATSTQHDFDESRPERKRSRAAYALAMKRAFPRDIQE